MSSNFDPRPTMLRDDDIFSAWEILSPSGHSVLSKSQVLDGLKTFFPHITARDVRALVGPGNLSVDKLRNLIFKTETPAGMPEIDANKEAFRIIDPHGTGYVEMSVLKRLLLQLPGVDHLDDADMQFLTSMVDADKDGRVSLRDFAQIGSWEPVVEEASTSVKKMAIERKQTMSQNVE
ncbi:hypothetical protein CEUSTIGMA_g197.t1 [Chlamydomonas eustigma]|uniref:EF-hand domain-containing protein n=1 Tax=Chlamydomonas eustigma TaxID=1157962 RepID=A0A250WPM4_9CHLO|nr:hypothetical protein CEUSTIGMA_g197.t1 [Chlamydomonas eustigma]|eukprot:GAX72741.1 hypothetical protein CEUSTIGMA_g197.t1 [Chlamydomonas eustigma]